MCNSVHTKKCKKLPKYVLCMCLMSSWICSRSPGSCDSRRIHWLGPGSWHRADCVIIRGYSLDLLWKVHKVRPAGQTSEQFHRKFQGDSTCRSVAFKHIAILHPDETNALSLFQKRLETVVKGLGTCLAMHQVKQRERERERKREKERERLTVWDNSHWALHSSATLHCHHPAGTSTVSPCLRTIKTVKTLFVSCLEKLSTNNCWFICQRSGSNSSTTTWAEASESLQVQRWGMLA